MSSQVVYRAPLTPTERQLVRRDQSRREKMRHILLVVDEQVAKAQARRIFQKGSRA